MLYILNLWLTTSQWGIVLQGFIRVMQRTALDEQIIVSYFTEITIIGFCVLVSQNIDNNSEDVSNFIVTAVCVLWALRGMKNKNVFRLVCFL